jgi:uncharacterized protein YajQ (UPF0234 family)
VDSLVRKIKRSEQKKIKQLIKEETPKVVSTPPKNNKTVWKQKEEAPKSTTTPP